MSVLLFYSPQLERKRVEQSVSRESIKQEKTRKIVWITSPRGLYLLHTHYHFGLEFD